MKLWLLRPVEGDPHWNPWCDKAFGFVIRADTEALARGIAAVGSGDEGPTAWADDAHSTCTELTTDGPPELVIQDYRAG